jgi:hypothetical protein
LELERVILTTLFLPVQKTPIVTIIIAKIKANTTKISFHYRKWYEYIIQSLADELSTCANAADKKGKCTSTYLHIK